MTIVLATKNKGKLAEFHELLKDYDIELLTLSDVNLDVRVEETGKTFEENALIKARDISEQLGNEYSVVADDSGLCIEALGNAPGVYSARFMEGHDYKEKCNVLVDLMRGFDNRYAKFVCCLAYVNKARNITRTFSGVAHGEIVKDYSSNANYGFAYDPIFYYPPMNMTFGRMTLEEKNKVSHRSIALKRLLEFIISIKYLL